MTRTAPVVFSFALLLCVSRPANAGGAAAAAAPTGSGDLNFDLFGPPKTPGVDPAAAARLAELDRKVKLRRRMLLAHQALGFTTLGVLAATLVIGQLNYQDKYYGSYTERYQTPHLALAAGSTALFAATGLTALFAPNPYPKQIKRDTALAHKILMGIATAGMVTQIILGPITTAHAGRPDQKTLATAHLGVGYATWAMMAAGTIVYFF